MEFLKTIDLFLIFQQEKDIKLYFSLIVLILSLLSFLLLHYISKKSNLKNKNFFGSLFLIILIFIDFFAFFKISERNDNLYPTKERYIQFMENVFKEVKKHNSNIDKSSLNYIQVDLLKYCFASNHYENSIEKVFKCYEYETSYGKNKNNLFEEYEESVNQILGKLKTID